MTHQHGTPDGGTPDNRATGPDARPVPDSVTAIASATGSDLVAVPDPVPLRPEQPRTGGTHRRAKGLLDRWYLILAAALVIASFPVLASLLGGQPATDGPVPPLPLAAGAPTISTPTGGPTLTPSAGRAASAPAPSRTGSSVPGSPAGSSAIAAPAVATPSPTAPGPSGPATLTVSATRALFRGDSVRTARTVLSMGTDGDLVITDLAGKRLWHANTAGSGYQATFQDDGNFVVYTQPQQPLWSSGTAGHPGAVLVLQANGDVCVVAGVKPLWCAGTTH